METWKRLIEKGVKEKHKQKAEEVDDGKLKPKEDKRHKRHRHSSGILDFFRVQSGGHKYKDAFIQSGNSKRTENTVRSHGKKKKK